jgi:hypothetical protein
LLYLYPISFRVVRVPAKTAGVLPVQTPLFSLTALPGAGVLIRSSGTGTHGGLTLVLLLDFGESSERVPFENKERRRRSSTEACH